MHVVPATAGTDGDVFPHVGFVAAFRARGHRVALAAPETYRARAPALVVEFRALVTVVEVDGVHVANPGVL